jgi:hypothetical protein
MHQLFVPTAAALACAGALAIAGPAGAQSLTDVQKTFRHPNTLTMAPELTEPPEAADPAVRLDFSDQTTPAASSQGIPSPQTLHPAPPGHITPKEANVRRLILYGLQLTFYEHVMRLATQDFTRQQLKGKFWPEYFDSVHVPEKWGDKDGWQVNYIGHAISGGAYTRIWMDQREPRNPSKSQYLKSIGKAFIYTALFSVQYEMGPMSEASIGNVGLNREDLGWNDYIWTPIGGVLWTMGEDAIDKYALSWLDRHVPFVMAKAAARMIANPSRMLANIGQNRSPWGRQDRTINGERIER